MQILIQRAWASPACCRAWELCLLESPGLGRKSRVHATLPRKCEKCEGSENFPLYRAGRNCLPSQQGPSFLPGSHGFSSRCRSWSWAALKEKFQPGKQSQTRQHPIWARQALASPDTAAPCRTPESWEEEPSCTTRTWQRWTALPVLPIKKTLTNILPRFNVHLFLTRGTYSIKISYWINDIH